MIACKFAIIIKLTIHKIGYFDYILLYCEYVIRLSDMQVCSSILHYIKRHSSVNKKKFNSSVTYSDHIGDLGENIIELNNFLVFKQLG